MQAPQPPLSTTTFDVVDGIARVGLNRPDVMNALNQVAIAELAALFKQVAADPDIKGAILTGAGERAFIAGADIGELAAATPLEAEARARAGQELFTFVETLGKPVVAAINGVALGGGCEAALACTFRIAVPEALFGQPEVRLGLIPGFGGTQRLPRLIGRGAALRMILTGDAIPAQEALALGLIDEIVEPLKLLDHATELLERILRNAPVAVRFAMAAIGQAGAVSLADGLASERQMFGLCASTTDKAEGTAAFRDKRAPHFIGR